MTHSSNRITENLPRSIGNGTEFLGVGSDEPTWQRVREWRHSRPQEARSFSLCPEESPGGGASSHGPVARSVAKPPAHPDRREASPRPVGAHSLIPCWWLAW